MRTRHLAGLASSALIAGCGGGGGSSSLPVNILTYSSPVLNTLASYSHQVIDNSNNTINLDLQYSYTAVNSDGSYTLHQDDLSGRVVVNGTPYGGFSYIEQYNTAGNLALRNLVTGATPYTCNFSPAEAPIPLPLTVGGTWSTSSIATCTDGRTLSYSFTNGSVVAVEDMSVPAGTFHAVHVRYTVNLTSSVAAYTEHIAIDAWIDLASGRYAKLQQAYSYTGGLPQTGYPVTDTIQLTSLRIGT